MIQEDIYEEFIARCIERVKAIKQGDPRNPDTMVGAQASTEQQEKILSYLTIGVEEGAEVLVGGNAARFNGELAGGNYIQPTILKGHNKMRVFQEEIFGPVVSVTTFKDEAEALAIANDTMYGLAPGSGRVMQTPVTGLAARLRRAVSGSTTITPTRPTQPLAGINSQASGAKPIR